jgi:hypothetical protein
MITLLDLLTNALCAPIHSRRGSTSEYHHQLLGKLPASSSVSSGRIFLMLPHSYSWSRGGAWESSRSNGSSLGSCSRSRKGDCYGSFSMDSQGRRRC